MTTGTGRRLFQEMIIDRKVRSGDIFLNLGSALVQDIYSVVANSEAAINSSLDSMYDNIRQNVTLAIGEDAQDVAFSPVSQRDAASERRLHELVTTVSVLKARHTLLFARDNGALDSLL